MAGETFKSEGGDRIWDEVSGVEQSEREKREWSIDEIISLVKKNFREAQRLYAGNEEFKKVADGQIGESLLAGGHITEWAIRFKVILGNVGLEEIRDNPDQYLFNSQDRIERCLARTAVLDAKLDMLRQEYPLGRVLPKDDPFDDSQRTWHEYEEVIPEYAQLAADFLNLSGYPEEIVEDMVIAMYEAASDYCPDRKFSDRVAEEDELFLSMTKLRERLLEMSFLAGDIGAEGVKALHDQCGILNFSNYPGAKLADQYRWLIGDDEVVKNYENPNHPVYMRITDGINDDNGAFGDDEDLGSWRTQLFFEVGPNTEQDLEKIGDLLWSRRPFISTLEIGGHGSTETSGDYIWFGGAALTSRKVLEEIKELLPEGYSDITWEDPAITKILGILQPDKEDNGIATVILQSCSQGKKESKIAEVVAGVTLRSIKQPQTTVKVFAIDNPGTLESDILVPGTIEASSDTSLISVEATRGAQGQITAWRKTYGEEKAVYDESLHSRYMKSFLSSLRDERKNEGKAVSFVDKDGRRYGDEAAVLRAIREGEFSGYRYKKEEVPVSELGEPDRPREKGGESSEKQE